ncbi:MAG: glycosyltransferase family 39 protein [Ardenticatenaceae bacterium]|nr:glycosyltransferase family 39 protein [Ardenticatenaceae bacterium]
MSVYDRVQYTVEKLIPIGLLLFVFAAVMASIRVTAPTYDEYEYISRGYLYLKTGDTHLKLRHPVLLDELAAAPLLLLPEIQLPLDEPSLAAGDFHVFARVFFWEANESLVDRMITLARLPKIFLLLLLATAVYRWTCEIFGRKAGLVAMSLAVFDPNLLAHGRLVTPDVGQTFFIFLAAFTWWRYLRHRLVACSGCWHRCGMAQTADSRRLSFIRFCLVTVAYQRPFAAELIVATVGGFVRRVSASLAIIWAVYRFRGPG